MLINLHLTEHVIAMTEDTVDIYRLQLGHMEKAQNFRAVGNRFSLPNMSEWLQEFVIRMPQ